MTSEKIKEYLWWFLLQNDRAVEQVILELYHQQTNDEKNYHITCHRNNRGFSAAHARTGSYLAQKIISGQHLNNVKREQSRRIALHYIKQAKGWLDHIDIGLPNSILKEIKKEHYVS